MIKREDFGGRRLNARQLQGRPHPMRIAGFRRQWAKKRKLRHSGTMRYTGSTQCLLHDLAGVSISARTATPRMWHNSGRLAKPVYNWLSSRSWNSCWNLPDKSVADVNGSK